MLRRFVVLGLMSIACLGQAMQPASLYQIDVIAFVPQDEITVSESGPTPLLAPEGPEAIHLNEVSSALTPYHLLPLSDSTLRHEYWTLSHSAQYQVLFHYSWLQTANSRRPVALPVTQKENWNVEGSLKIRQSQYYLMEAELLFSNLEEAQKSFLFSQKRRLKEDTLYYLDHPKAGMLIKIHKLT